jgi:sterol desaturase/sphingolipid hydroxylase (fatty acid hydroxylase superfamily)
MASGLLGKLQQDLEAPIEAAGVDKNFAIHFPWLDRIFGTHYLPDDKWPSGYGVLEQVPPGYLAQLKYPFDRKSE